MLLQLCVFLSPEGLRHWNVSLKHLATFTVTSPFKATGYRSGLRGFLLVEDWIWTDPRQIVVFWWWSGFRRHEELVKLILISEERWFFNIYWNVCCFISYLFLLSANRNMVEPLLTESQKRFEGVFFIIFCSFDGFFM